MTFEEWLAARNAEDEAEERRRCELDEREIRYWSRFRDAFQKWPDLIAQLDEPLPIEERIRKRRAERAELKKKVDEAWAQLCRDAVERGVPLKPPSWP